MSRKDYGNAATAFAQGYEKYPKGAKAADDLLKLGMSLTALNQKADACKSYGRLQHDFPSPPQSIKDRLERRKAARRLRRLMPLAQGRATIVAQGTAALKGNAGLDFAAWMAPLAPFEPRPHFGGRCLWRRRQYGLGAVGA